MDVRLLLSSCFFLAFGVYLFFGVYVMELDAKSPRNRMFSILMTTLCLWSLGFAISNSALTESYAAIWRRIAAVGWVTTPAVLFHFVLVLTTRFTLKNGARFHLLLYIPSMISLYIFSFSNKMATLQHRLIQRPFGWTNTVFTSGGNYFFYSYALVYLAATIWLLWRWGVRSDDKNVKGQSISIILSTVGILVFGGLSDLFIRGIWQISLPELAPLVLLIPIVIIYYSIKRYGFLRSPNTGDQGRILDFSSTDQLYSSLGRLFIFSGLLIFFVTWMQSADCCATTISFRIILGLFAILFGMVILLLNFGMKKNENMGRYAQLLLVLSIPPLSYMVLFSNLPALWSISVILMLASLVFTQRIWLILITVVAIASEFVVWVYGGAVDFISLLPKVVFLLGAYWMGSVVNRIYVNKHHSNLEQLKFQRLIAETSYNFMNVDSDNVEVKIQQLLDSILATFEVYRVQFVTLDETKKVLEVSQEAVKPEFETKVGSKMEFSVELWDHAIEEIKLRNHLCKTDIEKARTLGEIEFEIESPALSVPVLEESNIFGLLELYSVKDIPCGEETISQIMILANTLGDGLFKINKTKEIECLAYYDELTGLPNRVLLLNLLDETLARIETEGRHLAALYLDLDNFKMINETFGHSHGDTILQDIACKLKAQLNNDGVVSRFGADEFILLTDNFETIDQLSPIVEEIMDAFKEPFIVLEQELFVSVSIGVAVSPFDGKDGATLVKNADIALAFAKENGKNQIVFCTPEIKDSTRNEFILSSELFKAEERNELLLAYQPQVDLKSGRLIGYEALIRWQHPERGIIPPNIFIPLAEKNGLIHSIGTWVLRTACAQNKKWHDLGFSKLPIAVNLSPMQFNDPDLAIKIKQILEQTGLEAKYLELEITESVAGHDSDRTIKMLKDLKSLGLDVAIDDFGTEYSSLGRIKDLPIDRIKIDMQFIRGIEHNEKDRAIIGVIVNLASSLGMSVLAEGIENATHKKFLKETGCYQGQGYYFAKPMYAADMQEFIQNDLLQNA